MEGGPVFYLSRFLSYKGGFIMYERTMKDLQEGFAGESMANRKYLAFAD